MIALGMFLFSPSLLSSVRSSAVLIDLHWVSSKVVTDIGYDIAGTIYELIIVRVERSGSRLVLALPARVRDCFSLCLYSSSMFPSTARRTPRPLLGVLLSSFFIFDLCPCEFLSHMSPDGCSLIVGGKESELKARICHMLLWNAIAWPHPLMMSFQSWAPCCRWSRVLISLSWKVLQRLEAMPLQSSTKASLFFSIFLFLLALSRVTPR